MLIHKRKLKTETNSHVLFIDEIQFIREQPRLSPVVLALPFLVAYVLAN